MKFQDEMKDGHRYCGRCAFEMTRKVRYHRYGWSNIRHRVYTYTCRNCGRVVYTTYKKPDEWGGCWVEQETRVLYSGRRK